MVIYSSVSVDLEIDSHSLVKDGGTEWCCRDACGERSGGRITGHDCSRYKESHGDPLGLFLSSSRPTSLLLGRGDGDKWQNHHNPSDRSDLSGSGLNTGLIGTLHIKVGDILQKSRNTTPDSLNRCNRTFKEFWTKGFNQPSWRSLPMRWIREGCTDVILTSQSLPT